MLPRELASTEETLLVKQPPELLHNKGVESTTEGMNVGSQVTFAASELSLLANASNTTSRHEGNVTSQDNEEKNMDPILGSLVVRGLDFRMLDRIIAPDLVDDVLRQMFVRTIAGSLPHDAQNANVTILNISSLFGKAALAAVPRKTTTGRRLRHGGSMKVSFQYVPPVNGTSDVRRSIEAQLRLLVRGGRAAERFDVALDTELANIGISLPDDSTSHFSIPWRPTHSVGQKEHADEANIVLFIILFFVMALAFSGLAATSLLSAL